MNVMKGLLTKVVQRVFALPGEVSAELMPELEKAASGIAKIGARQVKDMILALPIFLLFVRELLRRREEFAAQKQLFVIGAAAAFSTLGLVVLGTALTNLPVQILLLFSNPALAIFLLTSGGLFIAAVIILLSWLIIYALTFVLADDPIFEKVRDEFLTPRAKKVLRNVEKAVRNGGADPEKMRRAVEKALKSRGKSSDARKLEKSLGRVQRKLKSPPTGRSARSPKATGAARKTREASRSPRRRRNTMTGKSEATAEPQDR